MQGVSNAREKAEHATSELFQELDKDRDESLSRMEFVENVQGSSTIKDLLQGSS
jgi:hypothetical protein